MSTPIAVNGAAGRMGRTIIETAAERDDIEVVVGFHASEAGEIDGVEVVAADDVPAALDEYDPEIVVDFSTPEAALGIVAVVAGLFLPISEVRKRSWNGKLKSLRGGRTRIITRPGRVVYDGRRVYVEKEGSLSSFYALRIASIRGEGDDHPYSDAERKVENGEIERGSEEYHQQVARHKALWFSHRDLVQLVERMLLDETVDFDIFFGVSGNDRRWVDIEHARTVLGYDPQDNGEDWSSPP